MTKPLPPSPYQVGTVKPRGRLSPENVADAMDETQGRRIRLMERLAEVILDPSPEDQSKNAHRLTAVSSDHVLMQALMMLTKHARNIPDDLVGEKTAALTQMAKIAIECVKEGNAANSDLLRIKEHAEKMELEERRVAAAEEKSGAKKVPTLQEVRARLDAKPILEDDK